METAGPNPEEHYIEHPDAVREAAHQANRLLEDASLRRGGQIDDPAARQAEVQFASDTALTLQKYGNSIGPAIREAAADLVSPELHRRRNQAEREAEHDKLTGLANQAAFIKALRAAEADQRVAIIAFDVDNFGTINKQHNQATGDAAIILVARAIELAGRNYGTTRVFRAGDHGDEFYILGSPLAADAIMADAQSNLDRLTSSSQLVTDGTNQTYDSAMFQGLSVSSGWAQTRNEADANMQTQKRAKKAADPE